MNIIVVSNRLDRAISLGTRELLIAGVVLVLLLGSAAFGLGMIVAPGRVEPLLARLPGGHEKQNQIDALAIRVGQLQARIVELDLLARQVGQKTGIDIKPTSSNAIVPQGGPERSPRPFTLSSLGGLIDTTDNHIAAMIDQLTLAQAQLLQPSSNELPRKPPGSTAPMSSSVGWRVDPFTANQAFHEGLDFPGDTGLPIMASATGKVVFAGYHPQYGNMIELDHGNEITTRYAHCSQLKVKVGDTVHVGQPIALLGSTGRSTGPHLHFEIRYRGVAQNPLRFLEFASGIKYAEAKP